MADENSRKSEQEVDGVPVYLPDNLKASSFCNNIIAQFSPEEFSIDFINMGAVHNAFVARIALTPSHMKRFAKLTAQKVAEYEKMFGDIPETIEEQNK
ncbi:MAG: DUF3467 domain-containing protein [Pseudomonadota bacterium]|nr:DUF3467 domain-containing protein [Pseudomonadota bacterium]